MKFRYCYLQYLEEPRVADRPPLL